jgi:primosomal protein N' (replication factor Y)
MHYYEVLVSSPQFHGKEPLTYSYEKPLPIGTVVSVNLRSKEVVGVIIGEVKQPSFTTRPINKAVIPETFPAETLQLITWIQAYYPAPLGVLAQLILPSSLLRKRDLPSVPAATPIDKTTTLPKLGKDQQAALKTITVAKDTQTFLLHGDTGTGKTRLYIELALRTLKQDRSALILTPEIGLTPQLEQRLRESLPYPVITMHSNLTPAQRRSVWSQILQAKGPIVVMGPRSALFTPIKNLGLIVLDEAHDQAYKQEQAPHYHALRVAGQLSQLHKAQLVIGTATPLVTDYFVAEAKKIPILRLTERPAGQEVERSIEVVNLRDREQFPRQPHLSTPLIGHIHTALQNKQQSLVFLNRRGTARLVLCHVCGWNALCPRCDLPLTYHGDTHSIRCHTCGYQEKAPTSCPDCKSTDIIFKSIGTKSIVDELQREFPKAVIKRFDTDNLKADRLEHNFKDIVDGKVDILVGTQMLAKGLDLPNLSVVGVVVADTGLYFPDYTSEERTYQILTQVIGRVGRGHRKGVVVIQTYNPDSPAIQAAVKHDWGSFYAAQIKERKTFGFPPFYHTLKLTCVRASKVSAQTTSEKLVDLIHSTGLKVAIVGPAPSFYEKVGGKYSWQIVVKAKDRQELLKTIALLPANWYFDIDPSNLL